MDVYKNLNKNLREDNNIDPKALASANALLLMNKLKTNPSFMKMLQQITLPTDKYEAIMKFAELLGIPKERFTDFIENTQNQVQRNEPEQTDDNV